MAGRYRLRAALIGVGAALIGVVGLAAAAPALAQSTGEVAEGRVFLDRNRNDTLDGSEPGIAGVAVTNGRDVVTTDAEGRYRLPVQGETVIRITKPAGYAIPTDANQLPQFSYVHDAEGSRRDFRYPGVAPTGPLPDQIDFPLYEGEARERFEVVLISDPQPQSGREVGCIRDDFVSELIGTDAVFGITTGDIMFDDMSVLPRDNAVIAQIGIPWWNVPGNHEMKLLARDDGNAAETFKRI
jgi:hypothetical protein